MMYNTSRYTAAMLIALCASTAQAGAHLGVAFGNSSPDEEGFEDDNGYRLSVGSAINEHFSFEVAYTDLGSFEMEDEYVRAAEFLVGIPLNGADIEIDGFEVSGMGVAPLNDRFALFGRIGIFLWDASVNVQTTYEGSGSDSDDGTDLFLGLGAMFNVSDTVALKAEYNTYEAFDSDIDFISLGLQVNF